MTTPTYKLEMLPTHSGKVQTFHFGKCREGLEAAYSYSSNACAWRITFKETLVDAKIPSLLDLHSLSAYA
jgi:hypothetical protein